MNLPRRRLFLLPLALALVNCSHKEDNNPEAALNAAFETLQAALEAKSTDQVMDFLHEKFTAQATPGNGHAWARRTMMAAFVRYKAIRLVVSNVENRINPQFPNHATTHCNVLLIGAEGLVSGNAQRYIVELEWVREGQNWKLLRIIWQ